MSRTKKPLIAILIASLVTGLAFLLVIIGGDGLSSLERNLSSRLYHEKNTPTNVVVVGIDEQSIASPSQGGLDRFSTWTRSYYAAVLKNIELGEPSSVFYDILFSTETDGLKKKNIYQISQDYPTLGEFTTKILSYLSEVHPEDAAFAAELSLHNNVYLKKSLQLERGWDPTTQAMLFEGEVKAIDLFSELTLSGFDRVTASDESVTSSMIFSIPRYYLDVNKTEPEENIDFQLAERYLGRTIDESEIPLEKGQMLINYVKKPYQFETVSFSDVYNGKIDPSVFKDKVVLIGGTASILQDVRFTPIDAVTPMPGVEIHANAVQTLIDKNFLSDQATTDFMLQIFLSSLITACFALYGSIWLGTLAFLLSLAFYPFYAQWRFDHGTVVSFIIPVGCLVFAYLSVLAYRNFTEFAEKRKLREAFSHYVAPEVVAQLSEHPELLALGGERRNITAFFLDIENFTHLSEGLAPQEVVRVINLYFDALSKVVMQFGGSVDKFEGDAIMALFGAPVPSVDHAEKACRASLAIREKMAELNASTGYSLNVRIGLATGDAIVGNMGSEERFDYTAMGDTVNTASRLEGANKFYKTRILVTEDTAKAASSAIFARQVDTVRLKGKDHALGIYELMGTLEGASEAGRALVDEWHQALSAYGKGQWEQAEKGMKSVLEKLPNDGPASTLLSRMALLKMNTPPDWDGVWRFESK